VYWLFSDCAWDNTTACEAAIGSSEGRLTRLPVDICSP